MLKRITKDGIASLILLTLLGTALSFVFPLSLGAIIDRVVPHRAISTLQVLLFVLICVGVFEALIVMLRGQIIAYKAAELTVDISSSLINTIFKLPNADLLGEAGKTITSQVVTLNLFRDHCKELATFILQVSLTSIGFSIALYILNPGLFYAVIIGFISHFLIYFAIRPYVKSVVRNSVNEYAKFNTGLQSNIQSIETLRAYGLSSRISKSVGDYAKSAFLSGMRATKTTMFGAGISKFFSRIVETVVVFIGTTAVINGSMTLGELVTFQMFAARLFEPLARLPNAWENYQSIQQYSANWKGILDREKIKKTVTIKKFAVSDAPVLSVRNISFRYPGQEYVLENFSLEINVGEVVFLLGPSGSGKSTLVRLLTGLIEANSGEIEVLGHGITDIDESVFKLYVSCALQEPVLIPGSIYENISAFDDRIDQNTIEEAARISNCTKFIEKRTEGYDTFIGEHGIELSGGEKQRLCLARMIAADGALLILDEATTGLDRDLEIKTLSNIIKRRKPYQALLLITHREDLAVLGTRIIRLDEGRIIYDHHSDGTKIVELA